MDWKTFVSGLVGTIIGVAGAPFVQAVLSQKYANDKMIELAVEILKSDCKSAPGLVPARPWAGSVIEKFSPVHLGEDAKAALLHNSIAPGSFDSSFNSDFDIAKNPCDVKPASLPSAPSH